MLVKRAEEANWFRRIEREASFEIWTSCPCLSLLPLKEMSVTNDRLFLSSPSVFVSTHEHKRLHTHRTHSFSRFSVSVYFWYYTQVLLLPGCHLERIFATRRAKIVRTDRWTEKEKVMGGSKERVWQIITGIS